MPKFPHDSRQSARISLSPTIANKLCTKHYPWENVWALITPPTISVACADTGRGGSKPLSREIGSRIPARTNGFASYERVWIVWTGSDRTNGFGSYERVRTVRASSDRTNEFGSNERFGSNKRVRILSSANTSGIHQRFRTEQTSFMGFIYQCVVTAMV